MYRVLIAEDEVFVRLGLKMSVEWEKMDMRVIADAANGQQAWDIYEKEHPDIILTDIRMPVMDGMELIRRIRERDRETRIVILSCLEEFQLVREAISMGVSDYILKLTMTPEDMEKILQKVRTELESIRGSRKEQGEVSPEEKKRVLLDFFYYDSYDMESVKRRLERLALPFGQKNLLMAILEVDNYGRLQSRFKDEYGLLVSSAISNVLNELMGEYGNGFLIEEKETSYIMIAEHGKYMQKAEAERAFAQFLAKIQKTLRLYFQTSVTIGCSQMFDGYESLRTMYGQCRFCLSGKFFHSGGELLLYSAERNRDHFAAVKEAMEKLYEENGRQERMQAYAETGLEMYRKSPDQESMARFFKNLVGEEVNHMAMEKQKQFALSGEYVQRMDRAENLDQLLAVFHDLRYELYVDPDARKMNKTVASIMQYISTHYAKNMPLEQIAEEVELSPNYICSLFKKETGINLYQYIMEFRINRAKELLLSTNLKSYEIAAKTGFADESYFSRSFKKVTGQSPVEFRRSVFHKEDTVTKGG